jgi:hypothetical protein
VRENLTCDILCVRKLYERTEAEHADYSNTFKAGLVGLSVEDDTYSQGSQTKDQ